MLASPEPTSVKKTSQPSAMTNTEMNSRLVIKGAVHWIAEKLSVQKPDTSKNTLPIVSCKATIQMESTRLPVLFINTVPNAQLSAEPRASGTPMTEIWPPKPAALMTATPAKPSTSPITFNVNMDSPSHI